MGETYHLAPERLMALELFLGTLTLSIAAFRFLILRHRRRTTAELISDSLFIFSMCVSTANVVMVTYKLVDEIEIRKEYSGLVVELLLFAPKYLKVAIRPAPSRPR